MGTTRKTSISIDKTLVEQAEVLAKRLNISRNQLFEAAIEAFIENPDNQAVFDDSSRVAQDAKTTPQNREQLVINQGDIFWVQLDDASGLEPGIPHPHVVVQDNIFNHIFTEFFVNHADNFLLTITQFFSQYCRS